MVKELEFENGEVQDADQCDVDHDALDHGTRCPECDYVAPIPPPATTDITEYEEDE